MVVLFEITIIVDRGIKQLSVNTDERKSKEKPTLQCKGEKCHANAEDDYDSFMDTYESVQERTMTTIKNPTMNHALHLNARSFIDTKTFHVIPGKMECAV